MPTFSKSSLNKLGTLHPDLQRLLNEAIKHIDFTVVCGFRGENEQNKAVAKGKSKLSWPNSKHNKVPSLAVDVMPYYRDGIRWSDTEGLYYFVGVLKGLSILMGIPLRVGIDWDGDNDMHNQSFKDGPHIELKVKG